MQISSLAAITEYALVERAIYTATLYPCRLIRYR